MANSKKDGLNASSRGNIYRKSRRKQKKNSWLEDVEEYLGVMARWRRRVCDPIDRRRIIQEAQAKRKNARERRIRRKSKYCLINVIIIQAKWSENFKTEAI